MSYLGKHLLKEIDSRVSTLLVIHNILHESLFLDLISCVEYQLVFAEIKDSHKVGFSIVTTRSHHHIFSLVKVDIGQVLRVVLGLLILHSLDHFFLFDLGLLKSV